MPVLADVIGAMEEEILIEWNPWWTQDFEVEYVDREVEGRIARWMKRREIIPITGCRRSGKTTMMYILIEGLLQQVPPETVLFIKCDDERVQDESIIESAREKHAELFHPQGRVYVFLDEVQEAADWDKTVKRIYDLEKDVKIFLTGSRLLKHELSTSLAGRFAYFNVYPFSFKEFLRAKNLTIKDEVQMKSRRAEIRHYLREYVEWGGFPEIVLEDDEEMKRELLRFYSDSILYRDVVKRSGIKKSDKIEQMKNYLLTNVSNLLNYNRIAAHLAISPDTAASYLHALEEAYYIFSVPLFSYSLKKQQVNPKKIYCVDNGIRNSAGFRFSRDAGRLYENTVFLALKRTFDDIYYWRHPGGEVDFLVKEGEAITRAIQVCFDISSAEKREVDSLIAAMDEFGLDEGTLITDDSRTVREKEGKTIHYVPLWEWLLQNLG